MINVFQPSVGRKELEAVKQVFASNWLGRGTQCELFEAEFAEHLGVDKSEVLLFNSCTSALYIGLRALGIEPGDEVIIPTIHFVGVMNAVLRLGAIPVLSDVDRETLNITPAEIRRLKTTATKAVIILHYGGHPCDMDLIKKACGDIAIVEDAANAIASIFQVRACGTLGEMGVWSFDAMKIATMGDGGILWLKNPEHIKKAKTLRYLGLEQPSGQASLESGKDRWWEYNVTEPSGRHISNDILAAIGRIQLERLSEFIDYRQWIWKMYQEKLAHLPIKLPPEPRWDSTSSYYLYWIQVDPRDALAQYLAKHDIYTTFRYYPLHKAFRRKQVYHLAKGRETAYQNAHFVMEWTLNLPIHYAVTAEDVYYICGCIRRFVERRRE